MSQTAQADIGLIGLGVMGQNLALNIADHGHPVAVYNRTSSRTEEFVASDEAMGRRLTPCTTLEELAGALRRPRAIILMVKAGEATDQQIEALAPLLEPGDLIVDGGNARYLDTIRRDRALRERGLLFSGTGISGGEEGARHGPSIMPGGAAEAYARVAPVFEAIAAEVDGQPCCAHIGPDGAGHFVKMLHNGIEYADMQLIAETYAVMKDAIGLRYPEMQAVFAEWNRGELDSYLIEITADILGKNDPETGQPMPEIILDRAAQKGTGAWAVAAALELGAPAPVLAAAVGARSLSMLKDERVRAAEVLAGPTQRLEGDKGALVTALRDTLLAAKVCAYAEGFAIMAAAGKAYDWPLDFGTIASIWRGGCIIRARFLHRIKEAYERDAAVANLLVDPYFADLVTQAHGAWRHVVGTATRHGVAVPALTAALSYLDGYRAARLPANLIQAQRDYFGAHTYERVDRPGTFHTEWTAI
ncbi:MAG TPA: NADP-dependent phosphogluconate dehydrogenase [Geminicoccaceae bacterium]|nr:NADP-dependent phosphogluconate dehydrogenase [Geminicoccaceae bacterium]